MYVIYPADELLRIYENPGHGLSTVLTGERRSSCQIAVIAVTGKSNSANAAEEGRRRRRERRGDWGQARRKRGAAKRNDTRSHEAAKDSRPADPTRTMINSRGAGEDPANPLKDLTQPGLNEPLKQHNASALKLVQTGNESSSIHGKLLGAASLQPQPRLHPPPPRLLEAGRFTRLAAGSQTEGAADGK